MNSQQVHEKMLTLLVIKEMQVKTTMRYMRDHLILVRKSTVKKRREKCRQGCEGNSALLVELKIYKGYSYTIVNLFSHYEKQHKEFSKY